jgi:FkbM family methyltransferase
MKKIIYDFGANIGDSIPYYLRKADVVIAVEANPALCALMETRFSRELASGRLYIENCVLTTNSETEVCFYVHKQIHFVSQFPRPTDAYIGSFHQIMLPSLSPASIIDKYGKPFYIKIDIEHYDQVVLGNLFTNKIYPEFISAESHNIDIFAMLVASARYNAFKLVDGRSVCEKYKDFSFASNDGNSDFYSFPYHSAGPFGNDVFGNWMPANDFFLLLASEGLGWKDIHATNVVQTSMDSCVADPVIAHL